MFTSALGRVLENHFGLVLSLATALLVGLRVMAISAFDLQTTLVVVDTQGTAAIVAGSLIPNMMLLPMLVSLLRMVRAALALAEHQRHRSSRFRRAAFVALGAGLLFYPLGGVLILVVVCALALGLAWIVNWIGSWLTRATKGKVSWADADAQRSWLRGRPQVLTGIFFVGVFLGVLLITLSRVPWVPQERLTYGDEDVTGYVLNEDASTLTVLQDEPRGVLRMRSDGVSRELCATSKIDFPAWINDEWSSRLQRPLLGFMGPAPMVYETECD